jgi:ankyrin repeat protein
MVLLINSYCRQQDQIRDGSRNITTTDVAQSDEFPHPLSMQSIQQYRWAGLKKSFEEFGSGMTGGELFSFFLEGTYNAIPERNITTDDSIPIQQLLLSAERGFPPAQAVVDRVLRSYGIDWPPKYLIHRQPWLFEGTALGCSIAHTDLRALDAATADRAVEEFYQRGGYQQHYYSDAKTTLWRRWRDDNWQSNASSLRISISELGIGDMAQFDPTAKDESSPASSVLRCRNSEKDTALNKHELLYLSCLAGDPKAVSKLCTDGADASIIGEPGGATCLHWLFAFPEHEIHNVAGHLIRNGAQIDAELTTSLPVTKYTFPFSWPPGTALHWAVATSSCRAARVLISNGADCGRRNGDDPYMYDVNVRYLEQQGEDDSQGSYSVPSGICLGMSPIDLAACSHDFEILSEILAIGGPSSSYCASDEEGYTAFHRLQYNHIGRTIDERRFSYSAFNGPPVMRRESVFRVIQVLKEMGGDINALTKPSPHNIRKNDRPGSLTPLMLAVRAIDLDTVTSLLEHGSNVNNRNELGYNVLSQLPEGNDFKLCFDDLPAIVELLLKYRSQVTAKNPFLGFTPFASAIECKNLDVMRLLLEAGADPTEKNGKLGVMSWWVGSLDVLKYMSLWTKKRLWRQRDAKMAEVLTQYVFSRHVDEVHRVLNDVDEYGSSLLHYAVASGQPTVVQAVLAAGADVGAYRKEIKSSRDFSMNSAASIGVSGSPLDVCLHMKEECLANSKRGQANISPEGMETIVFLVK